jgi:hypothetical protein
LLTIAPFEISHHGEQALEMSPVSGPRELATAQTFRVRHQDGWSLDLALTRFSDGSMDVRCLDYSDGTPLPLHRLTHGLRMSVISGDSQESFVELSQARIKTLEPPFHSNLFKATESELDEGARCSVRKVLEEIDARAGTRENVLGDTSRRRGYFCAAFPDDDALRRPVGTSENAGDKS